MKTAVGDPPTPKQALVLHYIRAELAETGYPPSMRDIAAYFGWTSWNSAAVHIRPLAAKGLLRAVRRGKTSRYLPVVPDGCCPCCGRRRNP